MDEAAEKEYYAAQEMYASTGRNVQPIQAKLDAAVVGPAFFEKDDKVKFYTIGSPTLKLWTVSPSLQTHFRLMLCTLACQDLCSGLRDSSPSKLRHLVLGNILALK